MYKLFTLLKLYIKLYLDIEVQIYQHIHVKLPHVFIQDVHAFIQRKFMETLMRQALDYIHMCTM